MAAKNPDAIALLKADHRAVEDLFEQFEKARSADKKKALAKETEAISVPTVAVVQPQAETGNDELVLPGNLQAYEESPIFARTNG